MIVEILAGVLAAAIAIALFIRRARQARRETEQLKRLACAMLAAYEEEDGRL